MRWDPLNDQDWADALGMAPVPWFGARSDAPRATNRVLLDGQAASFGLLITDDLDLLLDDAPLTWVWSSFLRRAIIVDKSKGSLYLRTWGDKGDRQRLRLPASVADADKLFRDISNVPRPRAADVVTSMLAAFKALRASLAAYNADNVQIVHAFNLLIGASAHRSELEVCRDMNDLMAVASGGERLLQQYGTANVEHAVFILLNSAPPGVPPLDPDLLIRHAAGRFYQEAHFELERQAIAQYSLFGGRIPVDPTRGRQQRDARFTPTELARALVEHSLLGVPTRDELVVLDPACGCGVFLLEALRELEAKGCQKKIKLMGFDKSPVSEVMARFCLERAVAESRESGMTVEYELRCCDALTADWGQPDVILMNPPFASVNEMSPDERAVARDILGKAGHGKFDKSMAFMFKAAASLRPGGQMASVLPSTLFDSANGESWRSAMLEKVKVRLLGRFHGYGYFQGALVEPGFVVASEGQGQDERGLTVLVANEGTEDAALRSLRKGRKQFGSLDPGVHISFDYSTGAVTAAQWMPRTFAHEDLLAALSETPIVEQLFDVQQGAHSGANDIFIISLEELGTLPPSEQRYFRPAAGTKTIRDGRLLKTQYIFFPYNETGLQLRTLEEVVAHVPQFYAARLEHNRDRLLNRPSLVERRATEWWILNRERNWQRGKFPKLLTGYFGGIGGFAYDGTGEFVCVHGYAWLPLTKELSRVDDDPIDFHETDIPWAYCALLNSHPFQILLSCYCSRVQGGQFNLSKHFVNRVPLPDLFREEIPSDLVADLAVFGKTIAEGIPVDDNRLSHTVARAYGVGLSVWALEE
jgi:hypothetical protein